MKCKKQDTLIEPIEPPINQGLNTTQIEERIRAGKVNVTKNKIEKSYGSIIFSNLFNPFNIVLFSIAGLFLFFVIYLNVNGHRDIADQYFGVTKFTFLIPVLINSIIGSIQEIHSKNVLKKLKIVNEATALVIRNSQEQEIKISEIVLDDIIHLKAGLQASADMILKEGQVEVDESLLTGESDLVKKGPGDMIFSGSSIIVGSGKAQVNKVGEETYAASLSAKVKNLSRHKSELMTNIYNIIKLLGILLIVITLVVLGTLAYKVNRWGNDPTVWGENTNLTYSLTSMATWSRIVLTAGAFAIGVIPTGLILLTSVTLAVSIAKLASQKTMIQELFSLENLSRVDTICLDKTGTLTDGTMSVVELKSYIDEKEIENHIRTLLGSFEDYNQTALALVNKYGSLKAEVKEVIPFSSKSKSSGIVYPNGDRLVLGAPDYLLDKEGEEYQFVEKKAKEGKRVLALNLNDKVIALIVLSDNIRASAKDTLAFFYDNHVDVKIISGDNAWTVSKIAKDCGVKDADSAISLEGVELDTIPSLVERYTIFARVSPEQKQAIVEALQSKGKKVAMTGDGVNDILALRKSNASITFAKATDAAKACSDVVLLDNDFSHLKEVVGQGRRVVNNIQRTATLFLMKTSAFIILAFVLIPFKRGQMWFNVENIYMMQTCVTAIGGFLLSMEGTKQPIRGDFKSNVLPKALLSGILVVIAVLLPILMNQIPQGFNHKPLISSNNVSSLISILTTIAGLVVMISMAYPLNHYRIMVIGIIICVAFVLGMASPTSYIGGQASTFSMFKSVDGNFFHSQFFHEFFQPWHSAAVRELFSDYLSYVTIFGFFLLFLPIYICLIRKINQKFLKI